MNLPNLFNAAGESNDSFSFLSILLIDGHLRSSLAQIVDGQIKVINKSELRVFKTDEEGILQADKSLQELGPDSETVNQVVFGFEPGWIGKTGLIEIKKPFLKELTESLSLEPAGFVLITEAFVQYLVAQEPMLSAVCLYFQAQELHLFLIKQGKLFKKVSVGRSGEIVADLAEGLARLGKLAQKENQYFPAKMLLISSGLDEKNLKDQQQKIIGHNWTDDYPFLQAPTVEILTQDVLIAAVTKQGGKAIAQAKGITLVGVAEKSKKPQSQVFSKSENDDENNDFGFTEVTSPSQLDDDGAEEDPYPQKTYSNSSFETAQPETESNVVQLHDSKDATSFGIPIGAHKLPVIEKRMIETAVPDALEQKSKSTKKKTFGFFNSHKKMMIIGVIMGILTLVGLSYGSLFFISTAQVDIKLKTVTIAKDVNITLDPNADSSDPSKLILSASVVEKELSDSDTYETSGVKLVGEKASGKVTIFNKTNSEKTFESGTVLSSGDFNFTLDEEIKVASATVEIKSGSEVKNYGQVEAKITASEIGAESNLSKDTELIVANFDKSSYSATTIEDLSGGSSREIRVVSEKDRTSLLADLTKKLDEQAKKEFEEESGGGRYLVPTGDIKQSNIDFDAEVGDEVETLSLDLTTISQAVSYSSDDLKPLAKEVLNDELPEGYALLDENPGILSSPGDDATQSGKVMLDANLSAKAQPVVSVDDWKNDLLGKSIKQAKSDLEGKEEIEKVTIKIWPAFSEFIVKSLPKKLEKIIITVK